MSTIDTTGLDATKPATGVAVSKADERTFKSGVKTQLGNAKADIEDLQAQIDAQPTALADLDDVTLSSPKLDDAIMSDGSGGFVAAQITSTKLTVAQTAHGFSVGDPLRYDTGSGTWVAPSAASRNGDQIVNGVVDYVPGVDSFRVVLAGLIAYQSGLTAGSVYYLTDAGALSTTPGTVTVPVMFALSATEAILLAEGSIPVHPSMLDATGATSGHVLTADGSGGASFEATGGPLSPTVVSAGATWTPTLAHAAKYSVTLSQACDITLGDDLSAGEEAVGAIDLIPAGYAVTWANSNMKRESAVDTAISGAGSSDVVNLGYNVKIKSGSSFYHLWLIGTEEVTGSAFPATALAYLPLTSDYTDDVGAYDFTAQGSPAIIGTSPYGLSCPTTSDWLKRSGIPIDLDSDFTVYFAHHWDQSNPASQLTLFCMSNSASLDGFVEVRINLTGNLLVFMKDDSGTSHSAAAVSSAGQPNGVQLWKVMRSGTDLTLKCVSNGNQATDTFGAGTYTCDQMSIGIELRSASSTANGWGQGTTHPIYEVGPFYQRATTASDDTDVQAYLEGTRGLTFA